MMRLGVFGVAMLIACLAAAQGVKLLRTPKVGQESRYRLQADFDLAGVAATMTAVVIEKVTAVDASGSYTVESRQTQVRLRFGNSDKPQADSSPGAATYAASGEPLEIKNGNSDGTLGRMARLNGFFAPEKEVKPGDEWSHEYKPTPLSGGVGARVDYKAQKTEKLGPRNALVVKFTFREKGGATPAESSGTAWFDLETAELLKMESSMKNAPLAGPSALVDAKIVLVKELAN